jgi:hypothetical protein
MLNASKALAIPFRETDPDLNQGFTTTYKSKIYFVWHSPYLQPRSRLYLTAEPAELCRIPAVKNDPNQPATTTNF